MRSIRSVTIALSRGVSEPADSARWPLDGAGIGRLVTVVMDVAAVDAPDGCCGRETVSAGGADAGELGGEHVTHR